MALQCLLLFVCIGSVRAGLGVFDHGFYDSNATGLQLAAGCCKLSPEAQTLVTVTVPTCGRVAFSRVTLDMIAAQDYPNIEVLFVDDGKPGSLVSALREKYDVEVHSQIEGGEPNTYKATGPLRRANGLSVVVLELGRGPSLSIGEKRYAAAQRARGSVLVHWDDDDLFPPERVRLQALPILAGKTQVTVLGHSFFGDLPVGNVYSSYTNPIFLGSLAYSRELALNLGFADISLGEDLDFADRAVAGCNRLLVVRDVDSIYSRHSSTGARLGPRNSWSWEFVHDATSATITTTSKEVNSWVRFRQSTTPSWLTQEQHTAWIDAEEATAKQGSVCSPKNLHFPEDFVLQTYPFMPPVCCDDWFDPGCISNKNLLKQQRKRHALEDVVPFYAIDKNKVIDNNVDGKSYIQW